MRMRLHVETVEDLPMGDDASGSKALESWKKVMKYKRSLILINSLLKNNTYQNIIEKCR